MAVESDQVKRVDFVDNAPSDSGIPTPEVCHHMGLWSVNKNRSNFSDHDGKCMSDAEKIPLKVHLYTEGAYFNGTLSTSSFLAAGLNIFQTMSVASNN